MAMASYEFDEAAGMVEVCAQLTAPGQGLECSIVATLTTMNGNKAGKLPSVQYPIHTVTSNTIITLPFTTSARFRLQYNHPC